VSGAVSNPVRVGIIDSGIHASHPHVNGVAGGIAITRDGSEEPDYVDRIGHGTAVAAVIREKAPEAAIFAVKVFHDVLATRVESLIQGIDWCVAQRMDLINLSLGTQNTAHEALLRAAVDRVTATGIRLVAAYEDQGVRWLPGCLPGVVPVMLDWDCPRHEYRTAHLEDDRVVYYASGYPRPIPRIPPERNLKGISFAVANVTGLLAAGGAGPHSSQN
jgi:subtilisin family serine protease